MGNKTIDVSSLNEGQIKKLEKDIESLSTRTKIADAINKGRKDSIRKCFTDYIENGDKLYTAHKDNIISALFVNAIFKKLQIKLINNHSLIFTEIRSKFNVRPVRHMANILNENGEFIPEYDRTCANESDMDKTFIDVISL